MFTPTVHSSVVLHSLICHYHLVFILNLSSHCGILKLILRFDTNKCFASVPRAVKERFQYARIYGFTRFSEFSPS